MGIELTYRKQFAAFADALAAERGGK